MVSKGDGAAAKEALAELCQLYWYPLYAFLRRNGSSPSDAEDVTQGFFEQILRRGSIGKADPTKGKLRSYLLGGIKFYLKDEYRKAVRERRTGAEAMISIDADKAESRYLEIPDLSNSPENLYDRQWALAVLEGTVAELEADYETRGKGRHFELFSPFITLEATQASYRDVALRLELTEGTARVAVHRLRKEYRTKLRQIVGRTLAESDQTDEEIEHLMAILAQT